MNSYKGNNKQIKSIISEFNRIFPKKYELTFGKNLTIDTPLLSPSGEELKLRDTDKGIVLINIWARWCSPCINKLTEISNNIDKLKKIRIVNISIDRSFEDFNLSIKNKFTHFENYYSKDSNIIEELNVNVIPYSILLKDGKIEKINPTIDDLFQY